MMADLTSSRGPFSNAHSLLLLFILSTVAVLTGLNFSFSSNEGSDVPPARTSSSSRHLLLSEIRKFAADASDNVLNVHVVPHTHDDVGWRKTVDQYYYGLNNSIDTRGNVRSIITTVVQSLLDNPSRTFTLVEIKFFSMWWSEQNDAVKDSVRHLVANQQLVFVNGGWSMHDEACTHYMGMVDQTTLGHDFLVRELGVVPKVAWQLDPFGHSATQASLMTAAMGMDAIYFGRIDYQDLELRRLTQNCEGLWKPNSTQKAVFWGLTGSYQGNYGPPDGFWFDILGVNETEALVGANETRLLQRIHTFLEDLRIQSDQTQGNHILLTMGSDFHFSEAHYNFANYDLLVGAITNYQQWNMLDIPSIFNRYDRVNIFYSNPEYYTQWKHKEAVSARQKRMDSDSRSRKNSPINKDAVQWNTKTDDFFPYSDCPHCFWTGYFTSRAAFKRFERVASSFLLAARQIEAIIAKNGVADSSFPNRPLYPLEDALGIVQHHDAVSGTAMQHVADDYSKRLQAGLDRASEFVLSKLRETMLDNDEDLKDLVYCQLINETICQVSEAATNSGTTLYVIVYNPLATERSTIVRLPVSINATFKIDRVEEQDKGNDVDYYSFNNNTQLVRSVPASTLRANEEAKLMLMFDSGVLPAVGAVTFRIAIVNEEENMQDISLLSDTTTSFFRDKRHLQEDSSQYVNAFNGLLTVRFDRSTGMLNRVSGNGVDLDVAQSWGFYPSFDSALDTSDIPPRSPPQNSGAYIFRPSEPEQDLIPLPSATGGAVYVNTSVGMEVHISFEVPWIKQVTRVLTGQPYVEIEYTVGPIPIDDGRGKEIVTRFSSPIKSRGVFYTDSNGREFLERRRNYRQTWSLSTYEPVAGNYYPVNAAVYLQDSEAALSLAVDRSQGGASLREGSIEIMVQRRTLVDDGRGVDEPLNETSDGMTPHPPYGNATRKGHGVVIRGTHRIMVGKGPVGASLARSVMDGAFAEPLVFVGSAPSDNQIVFQRPSFSSLQAALPSNAMLITFVKLPSSENVNSTILVRLGHQYATGEDATLSAPVQIDLLHFLKDYRVIAVVEKTLSNNQDWHSWTKKRLDWTTDGITQTEGSDDDVSNTTITMGPLEIRTFEIVVQNEDEETVEK